MVAIAGFCAVTSTPPVNSAARQRFTTCSPEAEFERNPSQSLLPVASATHQAWPSVRETEVGEIPTVTVVFWLVAMEAGAA